MKIGFFFIIYCSGQCSIKQETFDLSHVDNSLHTIQKPKNIQESNCHLLFVIPMSIADTQLSSQDRTIRNNANHHAI